MSGSEKNSSAADTRLLLHRFMEMQQWERALDLATRELATEPDSAELHRAAGEAALMLEDLKRAGTHLKQAIRFGPEDDFTMYLLSIHALQSKDLREARKWIDQAIRQRPEEGSYWYQSARVAFDEINPTGAIEHARKALTFLPGDANCLNLIALAKKAPGEGGRKQVEAHVEELQAALTSDPENPYLLNNIGAALLGDLRRPAEAEVYFRKALAVNPRMREARLGLFRSLRSRQIVFRLLFAPLDYGLLPMARFIEWAGKKVWPLVPLIFLMPIFLALMVILGLLWCVYCYPAIKFYELLTLKELRQKAGDLGLAGRQLGWLVGVGHWPGGLRAALFLAVTGAYWTALSRWGIPWAENFLQTPAGQWGFIGLLVVVGCAGLYFSQGKRLRSREDFRLSG